jgi:hypothetical protein
MMATTIATTTALHTTGVTRFELPLRGESFGAIHGQIRQKPKGRAKA